MKLSRPLVVFDLETTGTWIEKDRIIEIAMIKMMPDGTRDTYETRVNPGMSIPKKVSEITGITDADVKDAPPFQEIALTVQEFIGDSDIGGFNVERFDLPILLREMGMAKVNLNTQGRDIYDAQKVFHVNERRDLTAAYKLYCEKDLKNAHAAMADAQATFDILEAQIDRYCDGKEEIENLKQFKYERLEKVADPDGKLAYWNGELYLTFGKYARKYSLKELARRDDGYLKWILSTDFNEEMKKEIAKALRS